MEFVPIFMFDEDPVTWCRKREAEGWHGLGIPDHFTMGGVPWGQVFVVAAQMALATERVRIVTTFANNLFRSPVEFAQAALGLQQVASGRFEAGLGAGYSPDEVRVIGGEFPSGPARARRYREAVRIVHDILHQDACHFDGEFYSVSVENLGPKVSEPPPLLGSLGGPWTARNVAPLLDRIEIVSQSSALRGETTLAEITGDQIADLAAIAHQANPSAPMSIGLPIAVGSGPAINASAEAFGTGFFRGLAGEASQVAERLAELSEMGFERCTVVSPLPGSYERIAPALFR